MYTETTVHLNRPPNPFVADRGLRNTVMTNIRSPTLARRHRHVDGHGRSNPASDTITIHPLVHEILRTIHSHNAPAGVVDDLLAVLLNTLHGWIFGFPQPRRLLPSRGNVQSESSCHDGREVRARSVKPSEHRGQKSRLFAAGALPGCLLLRVDRYQHPGRRVPLPARMTITVGFDDRYHAAGRDLLAENLCVPPELGDIDLNDTVIRDLLIRLRSRHH